MFTGRAFMYMVLFHTVNIYIYIMINIIMTVMIYDDAYTDMLILWVGNINVAHCDYCNRSFINTDNIINKDFCVMLVPNDIHLPLLFKTDNNTN